MGQSSSADMAGPVIVKAQSKHTASLIFLHGLGDSGHGWADAFRELQLQHIRCICPHAPVQPVTLNGGMQMPSWFDIYNLSVDSAEDKPGIVKASEILQGLIEEEEKIGIPSNRILVGGFSQGGSVALFNAFTNTKQLAGIIGLSTWMPLAKTFPAAQKGNKDIAVFQGHGDMDPLVQLKWGMMTSELMKTFTSHSTFKVYSGLMHSSSAKEMNDVKTFLEGLIKD